MESHISLCRRCGSDEAAYDELIQGVMPVMLQVNNGITKITQGNLRNERSRPILRRMCMRFNNLAARRRLKYFFTWHG